jgi:hypothetical protein
VRNLSLERGKRNIGLINIIELAQSTVARTPPNSLNRSLDRDPLCVPRIWRRDGRKKKPEPKTSRLLSCLSTTHRNERHQIPKNPNLDDPDRRPTLVAF